MAAAPAAAAVFGRRRLFNGKDLQGWQGDPTLFRVEKGCIVGGSLERPVPHNAFLTTEEEFSDFVLSLEFKLEGDEKANAGIQIRSRRVPNHHEMVGYQADIGEGYWGALYDESRRNRVLAKPEDALVRRALKRGQWNRYRIQCEGKRVQLRLNGIQTVDYTETDDTLEQKGLIGLQIHGGPPSRVLYRRLEIETLTAR
jgi:hypothetical protein